MYCRFKKIVVCVNAILLGAGLLFNSQAAQANAEQLAQLLSATVSMQAKFVHVMRDADGEVIDQSSGTMAWLKPNKFRWDIVDPLEQSIVVDGDTYYQFDRDLDQLIIEAVTPEITVLPSVLLSGSAASIEANYTVEAIVAVAISSTVSSTVSSTAKTDKLPHLFILKPRQSDAVFISIALEFNGNLLKVLSVEDDLDNISRFEFFPFENTAVVTDELFEIETSSTTEIIRQ